MGRDEPLPFRSYRHQLQCLGPAFDHAADLKRGRAAVLGGAIELGAVNERAAVVALHGIGGQRLLAIAGLEDFVLQPARKRDDALFALVGCQESFAFLPVLCAGLVSDGSLFLLQLSAQFGEGGANFLVGHGWLGTGNGVPHAARDHRGIKLHVLGLELAAHLFPDVVTDSVAPLLLGRLEHKGRSGGCWLGGSRFGSRGRSRFRRGRGGGWLAGLRWRRGLRESLGLREENENTAS